MKIKPTSLLATVYRFITNSYKFILSKYYTILAKATVDEVGTDLSVNGPTYLNMNTKLGDNVNFNRFEVRGDGEVNIGNNFHSGPDCLLLTRNHNYDNGSSIPYDDTYVRESVTIEDNVWLGARVIVLPGVNIREGAIVQAGSVVVRDVERCTVVGGHPAEKITTRDIDHYESLKDSGEFH